MDILDIVFLVIFALTAVITLLSLPNWIKIGEWYKKKLFGILILQVVGAVIMVYKDKHQISTQTNINPTQDTVYLRKIFDPERPLSVQKRETEETYYVKNGNNKLGYINCSLEQGQIIDDSIRTKRFNNLYYVKKENKVSNLKNFWFIIDSISPFKAGPRYEFFIRFGEGPASKINWQEKQMTFYKTNNGEINMDENLEFITDEKWQYSYYIGLGVGQPLGDFPFESVDFLNLIAFRLKID